MNFFFFFVYNFFHHLLSRWATQPLESARDQQDTAPTLPRCAACQSFMSMEMILWLVLFFHLLVFYFFYLFIYSLINFCCLRNCMLIFLDFQIFLCAVKADEYFVHEETLQNSPNANDWTAGKNLIGFRGSWISVAVFLVCPFWKYDFCCVSFSDNLMWN